MDSKSRGNATLRARRLIAATFAVAALTVAVGSASAATTSTTSSSVNTTTVVKTGGSVGPITAMKVSW